MGIPESDPITLPADAVQQQPTYDGALAEFEKAKPVRVLFDNGADSSPSGTRTAGDPYPGYEHSFTSLPAPGTKARSWYLGTHGALRTHPAAVSHIFRYLSTVDDLPAIDYRGNTGTGGLWGHASQWTWDWRQHHAGNAASYVSAPLKKNVTALGAGAVRLWIKSSRPDVDVQTTVSEIRDGHETFVQSGWLRGSERTLSTGTHNIFKQRSTLLEPIPTMRATDVQPMPRHHFTRVVIPLYFQGHAYRAGSRIRITISAPNGEQPIWSLGQPLPRTGTARIRIASSRAMPSRLVLPIVPGLSIDSASPACPALRNEPCRPAPVN